MNPALLFLLPLALCIMAGVIYIFERMDAPEPELDPWWLDEVPAPELEEIL